MSDGVTLIVNDDDAAFRIIVKQQRKEIDQLKEAIRRLADQDATLSVCNGNVTVTMDATLTDAEREAINEAAASYDDGCNERCKEMTKILRDLLERTK